jgi:hypothetical protein
MLQVDDLIEPRAEQILLFRLAALVPRQKRSKASESQIKVLQAVHFRPPDSWIAPACRFQITDLGILHGRQANFISLLGASMEPVK